MWLTLFRSRAGGEPPNAYACSGVTPGLRRTSSGWPCGSPVVVETTSTAPDCSAPLTLIELPFIAMVSWDRPDACDEFAASVGDAAAARGAGAVRRPPAPARARGRLIFARSGRSD